jgi:hypothetical protein
LPEGDANVGITRAVCHDPHEKTAHGATRNLSLPTNDYFTTSDVFTNSIIRT